MNTSEAAPQRAPDWQRIFLVLATTFGAAKLLLLALYSVHIQYVMDEYWQGGESWHIPDFYKSYDPVKTVLYTYYYEIARLAAHSSNELMTDARLLTFGAVVAMLLLLGWTWRRLGLERREILFALCVLLAYSNFMEHSFRVRSDSIALLFDVAAIGIACGGNPISPRRAFFTGAMVGLAFLCTQKAIYAALAIGVAMSISLFAAYGLRRTVVTGTACLGGFLAALALYVGAFQMQASMSVLGSVFTRPLDLVQHATHYYPYMGLFRWQTLELNWLPYTLCAAGLVVGATRWKNASVQKRFALLYTLVFCTCIFLHNQPWPYVFVSAIVFLAPWAVESLRALERRRELSSGVAALLLLALLGLSFKRDLVYLRKDNAVQEVVSDQAEALLAPGDAYEDGTGMITTRRLAGPMWWDGMAIARLFEEASRGDFTHVRAAFRANPKVWIWNYRIAAVAPIIGHALAESYVRIERNVLVAGCELSEHDRTFVVPWPGPYALYGRRGRANGEVLVDGRPVASPIVLPTGRRAVRLSAPTASPLFLLPADLPNHPVERVTAPPMELYANVYE